MKISIHKLGKNTVQTPEDFGYGCHFKCLIFESGSHVSPVALRLYFVAKDERELLVLLPL